MYSGASPEILLCPDGADWQLPPDRKTLQTTSTPVFQCVRPRQKLEVYRRPCGTAAWTCPEERKRRSAVGKDTGHPPRLSSGEGDQRFGQEGFEQAPLRILFGGLGFARAWGTIA